LAEYLVYELGPDGEARGSPTRVSAEHDAAAYIEATKIVSAEDSVVEVWREQSLIWHLQPPPGKMQHGAVSFVTGIGGDPDEAFCTDAG